MSKFITVKAEQIALGSVRTYLPTRINVDSISIYQRDYSRPFTRVYFVGAPSHYLPVEETPEELDKKIGLVW